MIPLKFEQMPLFTGGHSLLTVDLRVHLVGSSDTATVSYSIEQTDGDAIIELGVLGTISTRGELPSLGPVFTRLMQRARLHLLPF